MYIAQTPHIDPLMFHLALQQNAETDAVDGAEKTAFAWYAPVAVSPVIVSGASVACAKDQVHLCFIKVLSQLQGCPLSF